MPGDDDFEPWLGRIGKDDRSVGSTLARVRRAGGRATARGRRFTGARLGRGSGVGRVLGASDRFSGKRARRVVVKARIVKLGGKSMAAAAHLRYLQRDGTTREGERGALYGPGDDIVDGKAFLERGGGDRHQFRLILAPEDGAEYDDLKPLVRRLMEQAERDLGTKLDWVAVDHFNIGHSHSHIMLRGVDERGKDLIIARDYLTQGLRMRTAELVNLDLGPRTDREIQASQLRETTLERFTSIDRRLLRDAGDDHQLHVTAANPQEHALRMGRLRTLEKLGLAHEGRAGQWGLDPELEPTLRRMGERGDIIRTINRELREAGIQRLPQDHAVFDPKQDTDRSIVGKVVAIGLSDEHPDRRYMIVDGLDGCSHYANIGETTDAHVTGSIVRLSVQPAEIHAVDVTAAQVAATYGGRYSADLHGAYDPEIHEERAQAHIRGLEAMRRAIGKPERDANGSWTIGSDHLVNAQAYERRQSQRTPIQIKTLSRKPLEQLPAHDGETWLDRELLAKRPEALGRGFGADVRDALQRRQKWLTEQQLIETEDGVRYYRGNLLALLRQRELQRIISSLEQEMGLPHAAPVRGERIEGIVRRPVQVGDHRYALIEKSREFSLVPWRQVLERTIGKEVSGIMREEGISWMIGRSRGLGR